MFQLPIALWLLLLPWLLGGWYWWRSRRQLNRYCAPHLQSVMVISRWSWRLLPWRWLCVWVSLVLAFAQPIWISDALKAKHQPLRWVAVVDVSDSMQATDLAPNRLQQVRWTLESLAKEWQQGDAAGLVVFSGSHHWLVPITHDRQLWLAGVDMLQTNMLPLKGSLLLPTLLSLDASLENDVAVLVLSDGGDVVPLQTANTALKMHGILVGVGTTTGVMQQSISDMNGAGNLILPVDALTQFARKARLDYVTLQDVGAAEIAAWLTEWRKQQTTHTLDAGLGTPLQWWCVALAMMFWVGFGRWRRSEQRASSISLIVFVYGISLSLMPDVVFAQSAATLDYRHVIQQAQQALDEKQYHQANQSATQAFRIAVHKVDQGKALELLGLSLMQQSQWFAAGQAFRGALAHDATRDLSLQQLKQALSHLPKRLDMTNSSDKAGDRFEGVVADWDAATESWETKDVMVERQTQPRSPSTSVTISSDTNTFVPTRNYQEIGQEQRREWVLSGEMRQLVQDKKQFYQRLFSLEAGFAAVQEKPHTIDGVNSW